MLKIAVFFA